MTHVVSGTVRCALFLLHRGCGNSWCIGSRSALAWPAMLRQTFARAELAKLYTTKSGGSLSMSAGHCRCHFNEVSGCRHSSLPIRDSGCIMAMNIVAPARPDAGQSKK